MKIVKIKETHANTYGNHKESMKKTMRRIGDSSPVLSTAPSQTLGLGRSMEIFDISEKHKNHRKYKKPAKCAKVAFCLHGAHVFTKP